MTPSLKSRQEARVLRQFSLQAASLGAAPAGLGDVSISRLFKTTEVTAEDVVLDVACGTGQVVLAYGAVARHATGIDLSPAMIEQAQLLQAQSHRSNVRWMVGDAYELPFPDASFSIVTCRYALHHMLNPSRVIAEMARVCMPWGRICFADVYTTSDRAEAFDEFEQLRDPSHVRALTLDNLLDLAKTDELDQPTHSLYDCEVELEALLNGSFPETCRKQDLRELIVQNLDRNDLGVRTYRNGTGIVVAYPIAMVAARRI
jgi:SAM-dependent methyltransferase